MDMAITSPHPWSSMLHHRLRSATSRLRTPVRDTAGSMAIGPLQAHAGHGGQGIGRGGRIRVRTG